MPFEAYCFNSVNTVNRVQPPSLSKNTRSCVFSEIRPVVLLPQVNRFQLLFKQTLARFFTIDVETFRKSTYREITTSVQTYLCLLKSLRVDSVKQLYWSLVCHFGNIREFVDLNFFKRGVLNCFFKRYLSQTLKTKPFTVVNHFKLAVW